MMAISRGGSPYGKRTDSSTMVVRSRWSKLRHEVNLTLNEPSYSPLAMVISNLIMVAIFISTLAFILGSYPELADSHFLKLVDFVVVILFTVEYGLRFAVYEGNRCNFVLDAFNVIDLMAIAPFYIEMLLGDAVGGGVLRVLRVVRLLRLLRHSRDMQMFVVCMGNSVQGLKLLFVLFVLGALIFASLLWYCEKGVHDAEAGAFIRSDGSVSPFSDIPTTLWWAIVTMTTVGYGDMVPVETSGRVVATFAMVAGVLVLALPLSVVGTNFNEVYADAERVRLKEQTLRNVRRTGKARGKELLEMSEEVLESRAAAERLCSQLSALLASDEADARVGAAVEAQMEAHKANVLLGLDGINRLIGSMGRVSA